MPTAKQLERFALDRGWSYRQLANAIRETTGVDLHERTLSRICKGIFRPSRTTRDAIERFWAAQKKRQAEVS